MSGSKIICFTSTTTVGCTFLDWSMNYLTGNSEQFHYINGWNAITDNPLTTTNAHNHFKNHTSGINQAVECVQRLKQENTYATLYALGPRPEIVAEKLGISLTSISSAEWDAIVNELSLEYNKILQWLRHNDVKIVHVSLNNSMVLYSFFNRAPRSLLSPTQCSLTEHEETLDSIFFQNSASKWMQSSQSYVWDIRERLALNYRPFVNRPLDIDLSLPHAWVDSQELWFDGPKTIVNIMNKFDISISPSRYKEWLQVYQQWQQIQLDILNFVFRYKHIVDATVNNWSYDIDLTFYQEVVIQHCLIYQHNLNLKTWNLTKFPNNTMALHELLEPNIHPITNTY